MGEQFTQRVVQRCRLLGFRAQFRDDARRGAGQQRLAPTLKMRFNGAAQGAPGPPQIIGEDGAALAVGKATWISVDRAVQLGQS